jgi:glycosyltransferase involved in cell wall biosynthesis
MIYTDKRQPPTVSFVVPLYNEAETIGRCLQTILAEAEADDEVIVVDNGSTDASLRIAGAFDRVRVVSLPGQSIAAVRNYGARLASGAILGFIDADCLLVPGWRRQVVAALGEGEYAAVGSKCAVPENAAWIERAWYSQRPGARKVVRYINSGNLAVRRTVFNGVRGFDESLITGEDAELGWRLTGRGYRLLEDPAAAAVHLGNPKTLLDFYRKERWRGLGMFGTFRISRLDKPLIMTFLFLLSLSVSSLASLLFLWHGRFATALLLLLVSAAWAPLLTALFRGWQFGNIRKLPALAFLYLFYYAARSQALLQIARQELGRGKTAAQGGRG